MKDIRFLVFNPGHFHAALVLRRCRTGHEAHFGAVTRLFLDYVLRRQRLPEWEKPNMLAKYRLTTAGVHLARGGI